MSNQNYSYMNKYWNHFGDEPVIDTTEANLTVGGGMAISKILNAEYFREIDDSVYQRQRIRNLARVIEWATQAKNDTEDRLQLQVQEQTV